VLEAFEFAFSSDIAAYSRAFLEMLQGSHDGQVAVS
jgi:hypothetical protein